MNDRFPLALGARIVVRPSTVLGEPRAHDLAHAFLESLKNAGVETPSRRNR